MVAAAGLTGRGGAGFPTGIKMRSVAAGRGPKVVVANGMEGEPASEKDQALLARAPHLVLDGAVLAAEAVGADTVHLCLERDRYEQFDEVARASVNGAGRARPGPVADPRPAGPVRLQRGNLAGPVAERRGRPAGAGAAPAVRPRRPARPTLVDNVETLAHVALIARFGPAWFRDAGARDAPGTCSDHLRRGHLPRRLRSRDGARVGEVLALAEAAADAGALLIGGYGGTWQRISEVASLPLTRPGLRRAGASPGAGVLAVLPTNSCGISETARILGYLARQSAQQCGPCQFGLPAIADDFAQLALGRRTVTRQAAAPQAWRDSRPGRVPHPDGAAGWPPRPSPRSRRPARPRGPAPVPGLPAGARGPVLPDPPHDRPR